MTLVSEDAKKQYCKIVFDTFQTKKSIIGPKKGIFWAAERAPTGKPKLSRVTSGYGEHMFSLGRIRLTPKNGGYMGVA